MDEMDMGTQESAPREADTTTAEQQTREDRAEQLRAEARAALEPPTHFATPAWLGPGSREVAAPQIPIQADPIHEPLNVYAPTPSADAVPETGHWVEHRKPRVFVGVLLTVAVLGAVASLVFAILNQSIVAVGALVVCGLVAVIFRGALMSSGLTTVELKNSTLRIRMNGELSVFNLADPALRVEETGTPGSSDWRVLFESVHHRELILTPAHVNSNEFHDIISFYRAVADRERQDRFERFNR